MPDHHNPSRIEEGETQGVENVDLIADIRRQWYAVFVVLAAAAVAFGLWEWLGS